VLPYLLLLAEARRLRREAYDLAIVFRPDHWWGALLVASAGIPLRVGGRTPETTLLLTHSLAELPAQHATQHALDLARLALSAIGSGGPSVASLGPGAPFRIPPEAQTQADHLWRQLKLQPGPRQVVAIQPNAGVPLKSWPHDRWAALVDRLAQRSHLAVVLVGAPDDAPDLAEIRARLTDQTTPVLCGQTLAVSAAIYQRCAVLVGPDSGAAHLAAAVGTPTVRLYGPASAARFGPWPPSHDHCVMRADALACVPCGDLIAPPCGAHRLPACMLALGVADVLEHVEAILSRG
jgi:ADP-heptose:LPS heptosyltransferase